MKPSRNELWKRLGTGALLALLVAFLLAPRSVEAGCNGHVSSVSERSWSVSRLDALVQGDIQAGVTVLDDEQDSDREGPPICSGPSCSGNIPIPVTGGLASLDYGRADSLVASLAVPPIASGARRFRFQEESFDPTRLVSRVFHPPRFTV